MAEYFHTVGEIVDIVLTAIRADTGALSKLFPQTINEFNAGVELLTSLHRWNFTRKEGTIPITQGNRIMDLPVDCQNVEKVNVNVNGTNRILVEISQDEYKVSFPNFAIQGPPAAYAPGPYNVSSTAIPPKKTIMLGPTSDGAYTLDITYNATIKAFSAANMTEVPPIPQFAIPCLIAIVTSRMLVFTKASVAEVDRAEARFATLLGIAKRYDTGFNRKTQAMRLNTELSNYRAMRMRS